MKLLIKNRASGKTTGLIYTSEATGYPIVVCNSNMANYVKDMAERMGCTIPDPVTVSKLREGKHMDIKIYENVLLDEVNFVIRDALNEYLGCNVVCATMSNPNKE